MTDASLSRFHPALCLILSCYLAGCSFADQPEPPEPSLQVLPIPQQVEHLGSHVSLTHNTPILIPQTPSEHDLFLAHFLQRELSDHYDIATQVSRKSQIPPDQTAIIMGAAENPLIKELCTQTGIDVTADNPGPEGYVLRIDSNRILIAGSDHAGAFYGLQTLRQLLEPNSRDVTLPTIHIRDLPHKPFRAIRLHLPGPENIQFFKRFLRDFMALYKYNRVVMEVNAGMRFHRRPELNAGWVQFSQDLKYSCRDYIVGPRAENQCSPHHDASDGRIIEKQDLADLVAFARKHHIDVIPEICSLSHCYYLTTRHREIAGVPDAEWPESYCPLNPQSYDILFDVMDEYLEVIQPTMVHIGHDEWRVPIDLCPRCKDKDHNELFAQDVNKIHQYLAPKGVKTAMWGDHLLDGIIRGTGVRRRTSGNGNIYFMPGGLSPEQIEKWIPKDILVFNWHWDSAQTGRGEHIDIKYQQMGFQQVYGNFEPHIQNWPQRSRRPGVLGAAVSSWAPTRESAFGRDFLVDYIACANLLWSTHWPDLHRIHQRVEALMPTLRRDLRGYDDPSAHNDPVFPLHIAPFFNTTADSATLPTPLVGLKTGEVTAGKKVFSLPDSQLYDGKCAILAGTPNDEHPSLVSEVCGITVDKVVTSLIFLHACAQPAKARLSHQCHYNYLDASDWLGWYEIVYDDGYVENVPIRYRDNILEWSRRNARHGVGAGGDWGPTSGRYCYGADAVDCAAPGQADPITFYAFEWKNPRRGQRIAQVNLKTSTRGKALQNDMGYAVVKKTNAVVLLAISAVEKRPWPGSGARPWRE